MKRRALSILLIISFCTISWAQLPTVSFGEENDDYDNIMSSCTHFLGSQGESLYLLTRKTKTFAFICKDYMLMKCDKNLQSEWSVELPESEDHELLVCSMSENKFTSLIMDEGRKKGVITKYSVNLNDPAHTVHQEVFRNIETSKKEFIHWEASSPNKAFHCLIYVLLDEKQNSAEFAEILLDNELNILWEKQYNLRALNDIFVTNEGQVVTMGYNSNPEKEASSFIFSILDINNENSFLSEAQHFTAQKAAIVNYVNHKLVVSGLLRSSESTRRDTYYDGVFGLAFDFAANTCHSDTVHFTNTELNVFGNEKGTKKNKYGFADALVHEQQAQTTFGGAALFRRFYVVESRDYSGLSSRVFNQIGAVAVATDTNGHIIWHRPFRSETVQGEFGNLINIDIFGRGDQVYLMQNEHEKSPQTYDIAPTVKKLKATINSCCLAIYGISYDGSVQKNLFNQDSREMLIDNLFRLDDTHYIFMRAKGGHSTLGTLGF